MPYFVSRIAVHLQKHGLKSLLREGTRRLVSIFYVHNVLILHEKAPLDNIDDLIRKFNLRLTVRLARPDDVKMIKSKLRMAERPLVDERLSKGKELLVALNEKAELAAYLWLSYRDEFVAELDRVMDCPYIFDGFTYREFRGRGVMVALLQRSMEMLRDKGVKRLVILTLPDNKRIKKVLSRLGFVPKQRLAFRRVFFLKFYQEEQIK